MEYQKPSSAFLELLLNSTTEGIWSIGLDGLITFVNKTAVKMFGFASDLEMIGRHSHELVHHSRADGTHYPRVECPIYQAFQENRPVHLSDEVLWRQDGSCFRADYSSMPLSDDGKVIGAVVTFKDNTEKHALLEQLRVSQSWLTATLESIGDAVITTNADPTPQVTFLNRIAEELTGWTLAEAVGRDMTDIFHIVNQTSRLPAPNPVDRVIREGVVLGLANHTALIARNGTEYIIEDSAAPIKSADGSVQGCVLVFRDATSHYRLQSDKDAALVEVERERTKLASIFAQAPIPLALMAGPEHRVTFANQLYQTYFLPQPDYEGKPLKDLLPDAERQGFIAILDEVFRSGKPFVGSEQRFIYAPAGQTEREFFFNFVYEPLRGVDGSVEEILAVISDVTDQVRARAEHEHARTLIEKSAKELAIETEKLDALVAQSANAIALMRGPDLIFEIANEKWTELVSQRTYIGHRYVDIYPELVGTPAHLSIAEVYATGVPYVATEMKLNVRSRSGHFEDQYFDFANVRLHDSEGQPYGVYCNALNVTDRVTARLELEHAKLEAERANQTKSSFLANMSHEIRTPLGAILGFTDLLKDQSLEGKEREQFLDIISRSGRSLTRIIDDILDLAKVESGKLDVEMLEFSLFDLVGDVMDIFRERTQSKGTYLRFDKPAQVPDRICSDPTRLRQILINIIGNAIKFTDTGGVTIHVEAVGVEDQKFLFSVVVQDTGIGIPRDQRGQLFQPFAQADNTTTRRYGGTGLGLALSERLAKALGGDITIADGESGRGSCFAIRFVATSGVKSKNGIKVLPTPTPVLALDLPLRDIKVLLAEDAFDNQLLIKKILTKQGALVQIAADGGEAFRMALEGNFDIVLMDLQMPVMDGYEATRALREAGFKKPVIALTAHAMAEERARTIAAGCDGHLTKPLIPSELIETIQLRTRRN